MTSLQGTNRQTSSQHHEELCKLFASTILSLSADAAALRQLTSLRIAAEIGMEQSADPQLNTTNKVGDENSHPNLLYQAQLNGKGGNLQTEIIDSLRQIDLAVTSLEKNMSMLREVLAEEKRAIKQLEQVKAAAEAQNELMEQVLESCKGLHLPGDHVIDEKTKSEDYSKTNLTAPSNGNEMEPVRTEASNPHSENSGAISAIRIAPITQSELSTVSRNIRGRIRLAVLNDAVADIERVCRKKYTILARPSSAAAVGLARNGARSSKAHGGQGVYRVSKRYHEQLSMHRELEVEEHEGRPWISEQELRDSCAFFRTGESTARSILLILRTLKRLKQVCGKNSQITYICLSPDDQ